MHAEESRRVGRRSDSCALPLSPLSPLQPHLLFALPASVLLPLRPARAASSPRGPSVLDTTRSFVPTRRPPRKQPPQLRPTAPERRTGRRLRDTNAPRVGAAATTTTTTTTTTITAAAATAAAEGDASAGLGRGIPATDDDLEQHPRRRWRTVVVELPRPLGIVLEEADRAPSPRTAAQRTPRRTPRVVLDGDSADAPANPSARPASDQSRLSTESESGSAHGRGRARRRAVVVVSSVGPNSPASGLVHVGDVLVATSATFGDDTWPARSLQGAVAAIKSRCGNTVKLVLERQDPRKHDEDEDSDQEDEETDDYYDGNDGRDEVDDNCRQNVGDLREKQDDTMQQDRSCSNNDNNNFARSELSPGTDPRGSKSGTDGVNFGSRTDTTSVVDKRTRLDARLGQTGALPLPDAGMTVGPPKANTPEDTTDATRQGQGAWHLAGDGTVARGTGRDELPSVESATRSNTPQQASPAGAVLQESTVAAPDLETTVHDLLAEFVTFRTRRVADALLLRAEEAVRAYATAPNPRLSAILALFHGLKRAEAPLTLRFYNNLMWSFVQAREPQRAIDVFDELPNPNVECYTTLAKALTALRRPDEAILLLPAMRARGIAPNIYMYNAIISSCVRAGDLGKARALFSEMTSDNVSPNTVSWNIMLDWHARQKTGADRLAGIAQGFADMKASGIRPNTVTYTTLMKSYAASGAINKAEGIFVEMKKRFPVIRVDAAVYNTLLHAHSARLDWRRCLELLDEMKGRGQDRFAVSYRALQEEAEEATRLGPGDSSVSSSSSRNVLSNEKFRVPLSRVNITEEPLDVNDHGAGGGRRVAPNAVTYALVVKGCADAGRPAVARDVFNEMLECGITPPAQAVVSLLAAYASAGEFSSSVTLLKRLKEWGIVPDIRMMSSVMHACLNAGQPNAALTVFSKVKSSSSKPDVVMYTLLVKAYGMKGEFEKAFNVLKAMLREGSHCLPNVVTYNTLISCAVSHGRTDLALRALQYALDRPSRSRINNGTFDALVNVSFHDDVAKTSSATDALLAVEEFDEFVVEAVGGTLEDDVKLKQVSAGDKTADGQSVGASAIPKYSPLYLSYLMDAVHMVRQAGAFPNGQIYVALLETCELCEEWGIGMRLISERAKGGFVVGRASTSEARFFEEIFRSRGQR